MTSLPTIKSGLRQHKLDDQVLIYDSEGERVHLLDPTTACVLNLLQEGGWTADGIRDEIGARFKISPSDGFLPLAIDELRNSDLLASPASVAPLGEMKRREMVRKLAIGAGTAFLIPAIATLTANAAYAATLLPACAACTKNGECASNLCKKNQCTKTLAEGCVPKDAACVQECDCCTTGDCMSDMTCA